MAGKTWNVLFLCTGNSARSIMAEGILNAAGGGRFQAYSAGSHPAGKVNPFALAQLRKERIPAEGYRSKSWDEFGAPGAIQFDIVITVCSDAAGEACPVWPGRPLKAHWGIDDPARVQGTDREKAEAFERAYARLYSKIRTLMAIPVDRLDREALQQRLHAIGES